MSPRDADAKFGGLHSDIWRSVLEHLAHHELPKPLSGYTKESSWKEVENVRARLPSEGESGTTPRRDIWAPDLATMMRVSINFNLVAAPLLYKRSIVDSLSDFIVNLNRPSANPLIASKRELLGHVQFLHLELSHKHDQPKYEDLFRDKRYWVLIAPWLETPMTSPLGAQLIYERCRTEADQISSALTSLSTPHPPLFEALVPAFPILKRLSICAVYGPQTRRYDDAQSSGHIQHQAMETSCRLMSEVFSLSPLVDICSRGRPGPYSVRSILDWSQIPVTSPTPSVFVFHFRVDEQFIPAAIGAKTRWILEQNQRINPNTAVKVVGMTGDAILAAIDQRNSPDHDLSPIPDRSLQLEIYSSSKVETRPMRVRGRTEESYVAYMDADGELERFKIEAVLEAFHKQELENNGGWPEKEGDFVKWYAAIDTPPCEACGGEFNPDPRSRWGEMAGANLNTSFTERNGVRVESKANSGHPGAKMRKKD